MSALKHRYLDVWPTRSVKQKPALGVSVARTDPALRYSSPWPWVLGLSISIPIWAGVGWLLLRYV